MRAKSRAPPARLRAAPAVVTAGSSSDQLAELASGVTRIAEVLERLEAVAGPILTLLAVSLSQGEADAEAEGEMEVDGGEEEGGDDEVSLVG